MRIAAAVRMIPLVFLVASSAQTRSLRFEGIRRWSALLLILVACTAGAQSVNPANPLSCSDITVKAPIVSQAPTLVIPNGQPLRVASLRTISSASAMPGDSHDFEVMENLCIAHVIVIPQHTRVTAKVVDVKQEGHGHGGALVLAFQPLVLCSGETLLLGGSPTKHRDRHPARVVGDALGGFVADSMTPLAPIAAPIMIAKFFRKGLPLLIDKGAEQILHVQGDTAVRTDVTTEQHCDSGLPAGLLLRATHEESNAFARANSTKTIEIFRDGSVKYQCDLDAWTDSKHTECGRSTLKLNPEELRSLIALLDREPVQLLDGEYANHDFTLDYSSSMLIILLRSGWRQSLRLPGLTLSVSRNDGLYPSSVRTLVCRILGLRQRAGDAYGGTKTLVRGEWVDDSWCEESDVSGSKKR